MDLTPVRLVDTRDDLDERGLACPVVAEESDDLAGIQAQIHSLEDLDTPERLVHLT